MKDGFRRNSIQKAIIVTNTDNSETEFVFGLTQPQRLRFASELAKVRSEDRHMANILIAANEADLKLVEKFS